MPLHHDWMISQEGLQDEDAWIRYILEFNARYEKQRKFKKAARNIGILIILITVGVAFYFFQLWDLLIAYLIVLFLIFILLLFAGSGGGSGGGGGGNMNRDGGGLG
jgi:hypothetical protein